MQNAIWEREVGPIPDGFTVDHINKDRLDNRLENLRLATRSQQNQNKGLQKNNTSGFKGVSWSKQTNKYRAQIMVNKQSISLGFYTDPIEAAHIRDEAALEHFGEFAVLNFPIGETA